MPKSGAERTKLCLTKKRLRARQIGLCITCFKQSVSNNRSTCHSCSKNASHRTIELRALRRQNTNAQQVIAAHEQAGDTARAHHFNQGAAEHYRDALLHASNTADKLRISQKLARVLFFGDHPKDANQLLEGTLSHYERNPSESIKVAQLLVERAEHAWTNAQINTIIPDLASAIQIAKNAGDISLYKSANIRMAGYFLNLGWYKEAESVIRAVGTIAGEDRVLQSQFFAQSAIIASSRGLAKVAYYNFERALDAIKGADDAFNIVSIWNNYGRCAKALGNVDLAKINAERALLIARQNQIQWFIPYACLEYADLLSRMGHHAVACHYLRESLSYQTSTPIVELACAEIGIRLALEMKDDALLEQCSKPRLLKQAFASASPLIIGPVCASFARLYFIQGKVKQARILLHRALAVTKCSDQTWDLCLEVARQGDFNDIPQAKSLLEARAALPSSDVAHAYVSLFNAFVAQREDNSDRMRQYALEAVRRFEKLQWHNYTDLARTLLPSYEFQKQLIRHSHKPFIELRTMLTTREQQVAKLVLRGLTNRMIAQKLAIRETTVESHMSSIMSRLNVRSRHQLADAFSDSET